MSKECGFCNGTGIHPRYSKVACPRCHPWKPVARKADDTPDPDEQKPKDPDDGQTDPEPDDEDTEITCPNCKGDGKDEDGEECERCGGSGTIPNPNAGESEDDDKQVRKGNSSMLEALAEFDNEVRRRMRKFDETLAVASLKVAQANPMLYQQVTEEREEATLSMKRRRRYLESLTDYLELQGRGTTQHVTNSHLPR